MGRHSSLQRRVMTNNTVCFLHLVFIFSFFHFERPLLLEYLVRTKTNNQTKLKRCKVLLGLAQCLVRVARAVENLNLD